MAEEVKIGVITHYFSKVSVGIVNLTDGELKIGDKVRIKGHTSDLEESVDSMQIEHKDVKEAKKGDQVGIKVKEHVREHDIVYKIVG